MKKISVLIADDSALMRKTLRTIIDNDPALEVTAIARDGNDAVDKTRQIKPDVVTMDINMPGMDGITAMQIIVAEKLAAVIMVSSLTQEGAASTFEALELGAFDYIGKPGGTVSANLSKVSREITDKIKAAARGGKRSIATGRTPRITKKTYQSSVGKRAKKRLCKTSRKGLGFSGVAIGISTGGPRTIMDVLPLLPKNLNAAVFLVQHMPPGFTASFAKRLDSVCQMSCMEAQAGSVIQPGQIYLGKGGLHMTFYRKTTNEIILRTPKSPDHTFMPSVDVMMESALKSFGIDLLGIIMTGMGSDGAEALARINEQGGQTIAESEDSAIVFGMPKAAIDRGAAQLTLPSWDIAQAIIDTVGIC
jgi:two-component system chemotaxis response regulator CheB